MHRRTRAPFGLAALLLALELPVGAQVPGAAPPGGVWRAFLDSPGGALPFGLELDRREGGLGAVIHNGAERIRVPVVEFSAGTLTLSVEEYDSRIVAAFDPETGRLDGRWRKRRGGGRYTEMAFHATRGAQPRFPAPDRAPEDHAAVDGRWSVRFAADDHPAVGVFTSHAGGVVHGTFLTTLGDYRYLAGTQHGDLLRLSCFDGAHAFLFAARLQADGTLRGDFWSSDSWHETWTARRDPQAALPDAWSLTKADPSRLGGLRFPDLEGRVRSLDEPAWRGKARVLVAFGSWCPNCKDETAYLAELDRRYRGRGLVILGLAFEHGGGDLTRDTAQLKTYVRRQGIRFPVLIAGLSDKQKASQALPLLDRVRSYPTTVFLSRDGTVRGVHTGFSGPAAGSAHRDLRERFEALIEELLAGDPPRRPR